MRYFRVIGFALCVVVLGSETMAGKRSRSEETNTVESVVGTGNLSKQHRDDLVRKLGEIKKFLEASKDANAVRLLRFAAEVEKEVCTKKYGLVFEEHKERVDVELEHNLPVLTEDKRRFIDNGGEVNFLIEGDNLATLKLLEKTHRGKIDFIYIDPPYNTGNKDFIYNDCIVDVKDTFRHSKWLSFMKKRIEIAKRVMSNDGILFASIDDNEQAALRLLCDDIFGELNFVGSIAWESKTKCQNTKTARKQLQRKWEYILVYKKKPGRYEFALDEIGRYEYDKQDAKGEYREKTVEEMSARGMRGRETMIFPILGVMPQKGHQWKYGKDTVDEFEERGDLELINGRPSFRIRPDDDTAKCKPFWSFLDKSYGTGESANAELKSIIGENDFETVKPHQLIEYLVSKVCSYEKQSLVLDFFAGSGTTGHAVMNLNTKDGGRRKFILVQNNENGICEKVTYERLKRVIEKENYAARLKYYKIGYVPIDEKVYYEYANDLLKHIRELVELENAVDFSKDKSVAIALTDKDLEKFVENDKRLDACKAVYVGHDVLIGSVIKAKLKKHGVKVNIIPQYYYPELEG